MAINLVQALRLAGPTGLFKTPASVALVGAGGKTTALHLLARQWLQHAFIPASDKALLTTTTHFAASQAEWADMHIMIRNKTEMAVLEGALPSGVVMVTGPATQDRLQGLAPDSLELLHSRSKYLRFPLFIEADGSRMKPLKAPAEHEPLIPGFVDIVVVTAGVSALGKPLTHEWVHRPERFSELTGLNAGAPITPEALISLLANPAGGLKNIPATARRLVLFNQVDTLRLQKLAKHMAENLLQDYHAIIIASLRPEPKVFAVHERVGGVVLAAGASSRFGVAKQILEWQGETLVRRVAHTALSAGLSPVIVVCGAFASQVEAALQGLPVQVVYNPDWQSGQSSSVAAGVNALPIETGAAVFMLADQPQMPVELVKALVESHSQSISPLVIPRVGEHRANPVLFDRITFADLTALKGDIGGRALFSKYPILWVSWQDPAILLDIDQPEDYSSLPGVRN